MGKIKLCFFKYESWLIFGYVNLESKHLDVVGYSISDNHYDYIKFSNKWDGSLLKEIDFKDILTDSEIGNVGKERAIKMKNI